MTTTVTPVRLDEHLRSVLRDTACKSHTTWAIVRDGAVAEFSLGSGGTVELAGDRVNLSSEHGSMSLDMSGELYAVVAENAWYRCTPWTELIYLCMHEHDARMNSRTVLTCTGYGHGYTIWDIGIGDDSLDLYVMVRDDDHALNEMLKVVEGRSILRERSLLDAMIRISPPRLFMTKRASILVRQRIGVTDGAHTHFMPDVILNNVRYPTPVPEHMRCVIQIDPFSSLMDCRGNYHVWSVEDDPFQTLLQRYSKDYAEEKKMLRERVLRLLESRCLDDLEDVYRCSNAGIKDMLRVILAQTACDSRLGQHIRASALRLLVRVDAVNLPAVMTYLHKDLPMI